MSPYPRRLKFRGATYVRVANYGKYAPGGKGFVVSPLWFEQWYNIQPTQPHELEYFVRALEGAGFPATVGEGTPYPGPDAGGDFVESEEEWPSEVENAFYQAMDKGTAGYESYLKKKQGLPAHPPAAFFDLVRDAREIASSAFRSVDSPYKKGSEHAKKYVQDQLNALDQPTRDVLLHDLAAFDADGNPSGWLVSLGAQLSS